MSEVDDVNPLYAEIMAERASTYFRTVKKMQGALAVLSDFDQTFHSSAQNHEQRRLRQELFAEAAEQVWTFVIQREAMKLAHYEELFSDFGIPEEVRKGMGPKNCLFK